jgi:hypothetical protein
MTARRIPRNIRQYRWADDTIEAIKQLHTLDPDLSENQAVARNLRIIHNTFLSHLPSDLLEKYQRGELRRMEYDAWRDAKRAAAQQAAE